MAWKVLQNILKHQRKESLVTAIKHWEIQKT